MTDARIVLQEYQEWRGHLAPEDTAYICGAVRGKISLRQEFSDGVPVDILNPNQHVGVLTLPSGRRLEARSKVNVRNIFYMLAVASRLPSPFFDSLSAYESLDELLEFVAGYFAGAVHQQLDRGLFRAYVETEENLPFVRGRILVAADIQQNFVRRHRTYSQFAEFTWDVPENQVLRQVAHELSGWPFSAVTRRRLSSVDIALAELSLTRFGVSTLDGFQYNRHNEQYRDLHALCRLFMEGASLAEQEGPHSFQTFLLDMNQLFEKYLTVVAEDAFHARAEWVHAQWPMHLDQGGRVSMRPDVVVLGTAQRPVLIADAKYKRIEAGDFVNHDLYQMLAYLVASRVRDGLLVYPRHVNAPEVLSAIRNSEKRIGHFSFDLDGSISALKAEERRFQERLHELVDEVDPVSVI